MYLIELKFKIKDKVRVSTCDSTLLGFVTSIFIGETGVQYGIRYMNAGDIKSSYFYEEELEIVQEVKN